MQKTVLVAVLKSKDDLRILLEEKWYRIPDAFVPTRKFTHIAFYQPMSGFGKSGKKIEYYARVWKREVRKRIELLPNECKHERAQNEYLKCSFRKIEKLEKPIRNIIPRRVSFGFTNLITLRSARDILQLYHVASTEQIIERELLHLGITVIPQYHLSIPGKAQPYLRKVEPYGFKRYRIDLVIHCKHGNIAIECDNRKAHSSKIQKLKDTEKDSALTRLGWRVIRLTEDDILGDSDSCISRIKKAVDALGGHEK